MDRESVRQPLSALPEEIGRKRLLTRQEVLHNRSRATARLRRTSHTPALLFSFTGKDIHATVAQPAHPKSTAGGRRRVGYPPRRGGRAVAVIFTPNATVAQLVRARDS